MPQTPNANESTDQKWFSDDKAIESSKDDKLGREKFASELAQSIQSWTDDSSYVIALYGKWGSGKTSVKNLVVEKLVGDDAPLVIEFNPWEWSGQQKLTESFFQEIGNEIGLKGNDEHSKQKAKKLGATFKLLGGLLTAAGSVSTFAIPIPLLGLLTGASLKIAGESFKTTSEAIDAYAKLEGKSLKSIKKEIVTELQNFDQSILVIIDDIDRLTAIEIKMLFQLIKANADFPKMMYLLLCDREIIEESLKEIAPATDGKLFLEKIVQLDYNIPQASPKKIEDYFIKGLNQLLGNPVLANRFTNNAFQEIYLWGISPYLLSLRAVKRYLNSLQFQTNLHVSNGSYEVNFVDFMVLEVLRMFENKVYSSLFSYKTQLTAESKGVLSRKGTEESAIFERMFEYLISVSQDKDSTKQILYYLFPATRVHIDNVSMNDWFKDLRICHPEIFDRYFILDIPENDIQHGELEAFVENCNDYEFCYGKLKDWIEREVIQVAVQKLLRAFIEEIPKDKPVDFLRAFFDIGELLPTEQPGVVSIGTSDTIESIIYRYLEKFEKNARVIIMKEAIHSSEGIFLSLDQIISNKDRHKEDGLSRRPPLFDIPSLEEMYSLCLEKLNNAEKHTILNHFKMLSLLYNWIEISDESTVKLWVKTNIQTDEEILTFIEKLVFNSTTSGANSMTRKIHWGIHYRTLETFFDLQELEVRMQAISENPTLSEEQKEIISFFKIALRRKEEGRRDGPFNEDDKLS